MPFAIVILFLASVTMLSAIEPWPKPMQHILGGAEKSIDLPDYSVHYSIPEDPEIQQAGGSGGPIAVITIRDKSNKEIASLTTQSVGGRILENFRGLPQFEIWGRAGGGSWCRSLYRYEDNEYLWIRTDEFTDFPQFASDKGITTSMPGDEAVLYYVETRFPENK